MKNIERYLIDAADNFDRIWETGEISTERQITRLLTQKDQPIFLVGHRMTKNTPRHTHDFYEFMYIYEGTVLNVTGKKNIYMSSGDFCIMNLSSSHSIHVVDPAAIVINICIRKECFREGCLSDFYKSDNHISFFLKEQGEEDYLYIPRESRTDINPLLSEILFNSGCSDSIQRTRLAGNVMLLLADLIERNTYSYHGIDEQTMEILNYISKHFKDASLEHIAQKFNYNKSYLSRYIKQNVGKPLSALLNEMRMNKASQLLTDTGLSVQSIADEIGYQSYSHFHKVFKEWFNTTPNEYRQKFK